MNSLGISGYIFSEKDLDEWKGLNETCWSDHYWKKHNNDSEHYNISMASKPQPDYKLAYDSYLWKIAIQNANCVGLNGNILELLPGTSLTIPVALESLKFGGLLERIDCGQPIPLGNRFHFLVNWIQSDIFKKSDYRIPYDIIVGNHIIDDLIYYLHSSNISPDVEFYNDVNYTNPYLSKKKWENISSGENLDHYVSLITNLLLKLVNNLKRNSALILRHYPSTFAMRNGDIRSINVQMQTFFKVAIALRESNDTFSQFMDLSKVPVAPGSKYPNSFLMLKKMN